MNKKAKTIAILVVAFLAILTIGAYIKNINEQQNKAKEELKLDLELDYLYQRQNIAFKIYVGDEYQYHGSDDLNLQRVSLYLYAYRMDVPESDVTLDDVVAYFDNEFAEDGTPMVYHCPDSIRDYMDWWWHGGWKKIEKFQVCVINYLIDNGYDSDITKYGVEELQSIYPLVSE